MDPALPLLGRLRVNLLATTTHIPPNNRHRIPYPQEQVHNRPSAKYSCLCILLAAVGNLHLALPAQSYWRASRDVTITALGLWSGLRSGHLGTAVWSFQAPNGRAREVAPGYGRGG
jgi:hypothetical protein